MITLTKEEAQQVLDALEPIALYKAYNGDDWPARQVMPAIKTLRARLSEKEQESVAWMCPDDPEQETAFSWQSGHCSDCGKQRVPVYTAPSQHEWQGLTVEEVVAIYKTIPAEGSELEFAKAIEAKLKEKNT